MSSFSSLTESQFKNILLDSLKQDPLIDRAVLMIIYFFNHFKDKNKGLIMSCQIGSLGLAHVFIVQGADNWNEGLRGACLGGPHRKYHIELVLLMIKKGANDLGWGLYGACIMGHKEIVLLLIENKVHDWDFGLQGACRGGQKELALLMIENGANDFDWGLHFACEGGHIELVLLLNEKGANNWGEGLIGSCEGGQKELALLMIEKDKDTKSIPDENLNLFKHTFKIENY